MSSKGKFDRKCEICLRDNYNERMLGPLMHTKSISAHYSCVLYSPVTPDAVSLAHHQKDDGIAGVTARLIREEGSRSKQLVKIKMRWNYFCIDFSISVYFSRCFLCRFAIIVRRKASTSVAAKISAQTSCSNLARKSTTSTVEWKPGRCSVSAKSAVRPHSASNTEIRSNGKK